MKSLKKKILNRKIQHLITKNPFVLFFQFNNINFKHWIILKNQISNLQNVEMLIVKNKITCKMLNSNKFGSKLNNHIVLEKNKKQLSFLCQGPTLILTFSSLQECKSICKILNVFQNELLLEENFFSKSACDNKANCKVISLSKNAHLVNCKENFKTPLIFTEKKLILQSQKLNKVNQSGKIPNFFFVGGLAQGKIINHLQLKKLVSLSNSSYSDLIKECYNPITYLLLIILLKKIQFLKCFQINLVNILETHKNNAPKA